MRSVALLSVIAGLLSTAVACSSVDPMGDAIDQGEDKPAPKKHSTTPTDDNAPPESAPTPAPAAPAPDAGTDSASPTDPAPTTHYCADLSACCNSLASTTEKVACLGIQFTGKELACQGELALCGIGGIGGTPCGNLNTCCDQMLDEGYDGDAADCRGHNTGNASTCSGWLSQYQGMGWCD